MHTWTQEEVDALEVGDKIRRFYNDKNPNNKVIHVRGIVDGCAVVRTWFKHKQYWHYEVLPHHALFKEHDTKETL